MVSVSRRGIKRSPLVDGAIKPQRKPGEKYLFYLTLFIHDMA
ncbi:hypothetical protein BN433_0696 [Erwinia amylovora Ea266]|nr:hypothetical protein BN433_0696 [Erwinia amylovora Ea266]